MRLFAIVPAAGLSRRMGQPKLVMDLLGRPVVCWLLETLAQPEIEAAVIVMRKSDEALQTCMAKTDAVPVLPEVDPPDMRCSVEHGLAAIQEQFDPQPDDGWLLIPADHPILDADVLRELIAAWQRTQADILVPTHAGRRGHPTFFRWPLAAQVSSIPQSSGISFLLKASGNTIREYETVSPGVLLDLDTPADFEALVKSLTDETSSPSSAEPRLPS